MKQLSWRRLLVLSAFAFSITLVANTLDPAVFGHKILQLAPERPNTLLGFSTFAASLITIVMGPLIGGLSDQTRSRFGQRFPYLLIGVPVLITALFTIALAPSVSIFVIGVLLFRVGDNFIFTPWQALFADYVPPKQRGIGAGLKSLLDILAVLIGRFAAGELIAKAPDWGELAVLLAVSVPSIVLIAALVLTKLSTRGLSLIKERKPVNTRRLSPREFFKFDWRGKPAFTWWFINRTFFWTGFTILGTFLLFFVIDVAGLIEADAQRYLARLSLVLGGAILLAALPSGHLADRWGRKPMVVIACVLTTIGTALLVLMQDLNAITAAGGLIGLGAGIFISADFALLTDLVPNDKAGQYMGLSNIASAGGGAIARLLGGFLIDPINAISGSNAIGYISLYSLAAILFFFSVLAALRLPSAKAKSL